MKTIHQEWLSFASKVIPNEASELQYEECKRAFYGGALIVLMQMIEAGHKNIPADTLAKTIESHLAEVTEYVAETQRRIAIANEL